MDAEHKFLKDSQMTFEEVFDFAFKRIIPVLRGLAKEFGEDDFLEALQRAAFDSMLQAGQDEAGRLPCNDFAAYTAAGRAGSYFGEHVLTREIVEDTSQVFELKVTECLWAKSFRELGAAEIGYRLLCHPDYAHCQGFNPRITMLRSKTLMQGDDCCNHRFVWEDRSG